MECAQRWRKNMEFHLLIWLPIRDGYTEWIKRIYTQWSSSKEKNMNKLLMVIFTAISEFLRSILVVGVAVGILMLIAKFLCNINPHDSYSWISGIWHGLFFIPNYARGLLSPEILYKALDYTTMYNVFWWILVGLQVPTILFLLIRVLIAPIIAAFIVASDN